jgi:hypothetical protein
MSEATPGVNREGSSPSSSPGSSGKAPSTPTQEQHVPYERFAEVNNKARVAEQQIQALAQRDQQWAARDAARERQIQQMMRESHQNQRPVDQSQRTPDANEQLIRQSLGNDEAGKQAFETLERHFEHKYSQKAGQLVTKEELAYIKRDIEQGIKNELNSTFSTSNRFTEWVDKGMITPDQSRVLQTKLNQDLAQYPELAKRPRDIKARVSELLVEGMEGGEIKPFSQPRRENPISVGSGAAPNRPPVLDPGSSHFGRLRNLTPEAANRLRYLSQVRHNGANE